MTTLHPYITTYLNERVGLGRLTRKTARHIRYPLLTFADSFGDRPISHLNAGAVDRWLIQHAEVSPATRRYYLSVVRCFCRWLQRQGKIKSDPTNHLDPIRQPRAVPRCLTEGDIAALLASLPDVRARAVVWLMVGCGLRCIEIARLALGDYDPTTLSLTVKGKGDHERVVPVPAEVAAPLNLYIASTRSTAGPLLRSVKSPHRGVSAATLSRYVSEWMGAAEIKRGAHDGISAHALRHTCATDVYRRSLDLSIVQAMLGHANIATTSRYIGPTNIAQVRAAMEGRRYDGGRAAA